VPPEVGLTVYQAMLPLLRESPDARIVNVSSGVGSLTANADPAYPYHALFGPVYPARPGRPDGHVHEMGKRDDPVVIEDQAHRAGRGMPGSADQRQRMLRISDTGMKLWEEKPSAATTLKASEALIADHPRTRRSARSRREWHGKRGRQRVQP
jgi:hypothetical protein